jgi:plastocyanin
MSHRRNAVMIAVVALAIFAITASLALAATKSVGVKKSGAGFKFSTSTLRIKKGDTVKWSWSGTVPHNVKGNGFKSGTKTKLTFSHKFPSKGTFVVICTLHRAVGQKMKVVVG